MVHKELRKETNTGCAADKDLELWQFETEKEYKTGQTKWTKE